MPKTRQQKSASRDAAGAPATATDPYPTVVSNVRTALELFSGGAQIPLRDGTTTTTQAPRTTRTTTVARQTGILSEAVALTDLAQSNFAFFRERGFGTSEGHNKAESALRELAKFLSFNRQSLTNIAARNMKYASGELARTRAEIKDLEAALGETKEPEAKAMIEGNLNLAALRTLRLESLAAENQRIAAFLRGSEARETKR